MVRHTFCLVLLALCCTLGLSERADFATLFLQEEPAASLALQETLERSNDLTSARKLPSESNASLLSAAAADAARHVAIPEELNVSKLPTRVLFSRQGTNGFFYFRLFSFSLFG